MAKRIIKKNTFKNITTINFIEKFSFLTPVVFLGYDKTEEIRDFVLNQNLDRFYDTHPDEKRVYYHVEKAVEVNEYLEDWYITPTNTINILNYPINIRFTIGYEFQDFPNDMELRSLFLKQKLGDYYQLHNVTKIENGEEWQLKSENIENESDMNQYKISINGYPDTFSFFVTKKFKPFNNEDPEADDDGRSAILIIKMYELKADTNGHAYEDFVIEQVIDIEGGEEWVLGS
jgi:hypothetical protein